MIQKVAEQPEPKPTDQELERRSGADRRKPRSSFVERIGKARNRRAGKDRRGDDGHNGK